jgi:Skp family chaperone for outer membrane proteins
MESIKIKRPVIVKVKVTDSFKNRMAKELQEAIKKIETELQHLEFQSKRMIAELEKRNPPGIPAARQHLEQETQKRLQARQNLTEQLKNIGKLANGAEVVQGTLDSYTELRVGDDWNEIMGVEVVVCDDKIIAIRNRVGEKK